MCQQVMSCTCFRRCEYDGRSLAHHRSAPQLPSAQSCGNQRGYACNVHLALRMVRILAVTAHWHLGQYPLQSFNLPLERLRFQHLGQLCNLLCELLHSHSA